MKAEKQGLRSKSVLFCIVFIWNLVLQIACFQWTSQDAKLTRHKNPNWIYATSIGQPLHLVDPIFSMDSPATNKMPNKCRFSSFLTLVLGSWLLLWFCQYLRQQVVKKKKKNVKVHIMFYLSVPLYDSWIFWNIEWLHNAP